MREIDPAAFGRRVKERRKKLGMSGKELGKRLGMSQQGIASIEAGKSKRPGLGPELAKELGTTLAWLRWKEGPEEVVDQDKKQRETAKKLIDSMPGSEVAEFIRRSKHDAA